MKNNEVRIKRMRMTEVNGRLVQGWKKSSWEEGEVKNDDITSIRDW